MKNYLLFTPTIEYSFKVASRAFCDTNNRQFRIIKMCSKERDLYYIDNLISRDGSIPAIICASSISDYLRLKVVNDVKTIPIIPIVFIPNEKYILPDLSEDECKTIRDTIECIDCMDGKAIFEKYCDMDDAAAKLKSIISKGKSTTSINIPDTLNTIKKAQHQAKIKPISDKEVVPEIKKKHIVISCQTSDDDSIKSLSAYLYRKGKLFACNVSGDAISVAHPNRSNTGLPFDNYIGLNTATKYEFREQLNNPENIIQFSEILKYEDDPANDQFFNDMDGQWFVSYKSSSSTSYDELFRNAIRYIIKADDVWIKHTTG